MRKLSPARHRELHHARLNQIAWRPKADHSGFYAWCRLCDRNADRQVDWLIGRGYVAGARTTSATVNVTTVPAMTDPYLERYPR